MSRKYEMEVLQGDSSGILSVVVSDDKMSHPSFRVMLCNVSYEEYFLNGGRFVNFEFDKQDHSVEMESPDSSCHALENMITPCVDWIGNNVLGKWTLDISIPSLSVSPIVTWQFSELNDALMFKLSN